MIRVPAPCRAGSSHPRLELLPEPELSVACFRYAADDAFNAEILLRLTSSRLAAS